MSTMPSFYLRIHNTLPSHIEHSVCVYTSLDRVNFDVHPSPIYGYYPLSDLLTVLPDLNTRFAIQASNSYTKKLIDSAPWPQAEVDLVPGLTVRIVDDARDLQSCHYEPVFIRTDGSLVIWGDNEDDTLRFWIDSICLVLPTTTPVAGLPENDGIGPEDVSPWGNVPLPILDEFCHLYTFVDLLPGADTQGYYETSTWQGITGVEPSEGSLGFALPQRPRSPFSDGTTASILDSPFTADLESISPSYAPLMYVGEEDEAGSNVSLDFSLSIGGSDRSVSPAFSSPHGTVALAYYSTPPVSEQAESSPSSPRHSNVDTSALGSFAHGIDHMATREDEEASHLVPQPIMVNGSNAATGNANVDLRSAPNTCVLKRSLSDIAAGSAPARLTNPLPDIEYVQPKEEKRRKFLDIAPAPCPASASASTSAPTPTPAPAPTSATPQQRPGNRRRGGGSTAKNARGKRHPCEYCGKTFSRLQDQHRHSTTACDASPFRSTMDCPQCGAILSRKDAAQRHWRGHEDPTCPAPDWVSSRS